MKKLSMCSAIAVCLAMGAGGAAAQMSPTKEPNKVGPTNAVDCQSMWNAASPSSDGTIPASALEKYRVRMSQVDTNGDGRIAQSEFMNACNAGLIRG